MPIDHHYHVYIFSSRSRATYIGVTSDLAGRIESHRSGVMAGHTRRYRINRLVYFEGTTDITAAIAREKTAQGVATEQKNSADRIPQSDLGGFGQYRVQGASRCR